MQKVLIQSLCLWLALAASSLAQNLPNATDKLKLTGDVDASGITNAQAFRSAIGANSAANLTTGLLDDARLSTAILRSTVSYANPAWLTSLSFSKLTSLPTTLGGYGITDAQPSSATLSALSPLSTTGYGRGLLNLADTAALQSATGIIAIDTTLNVPGSYATFAAAWDFLKSKRILPSATATIKFADGSYSMGAIRYILNHPDGSRIRIIGNQTTPASVVLTFSQSTPTFGYPFDGVWGAFNLTNNNTLGYIDGLKMVGPGVAVTNQLMGLHAFNGGTIYSGPHMILDGFYAGLSAHFGAKIWADGGVVVKNGGDGNIWAYGCSMISCVGCESSGASTHFAKAGILADNHAYIFARNSNIHDNAGVGVAIFNNSSVSWDGSTISNSPYALWRDNIGSTYEGPFSTVTLSGISTGNREFQTGTVVLGTNNGDTGELLQVNGVARIGNLLFSSGGGDRIDSTNGLIALGLNTATNVSIGQGYGGSGTGKLWVGGSLFTDNGRKVQVTGDASISGDMQVGSLTVTGATAPKTILLKGSTTSSATVELTTDGAAVGGSNRIVVAEGSQMYASIYVQAFVNNTYSKNFAPRTVCIQNPTSYSSRIVGGAATVLGTDVSEDTSVSGWTIAVGVDATNNALQVNVTGNPASIAGVSSVKWTARVDLSVAQ